MSLKTERLRRKGCAWYHLRGCKAWDGLAKKSERRPPMAALHGRDRNKKKISISYRDIEPQYMLTSAPGGTRRYQPHRQDHCGAHIIPENITGIGICCSSFRYETQP